jgi:hypothetical protein
VIMGAQLLRREGREPRVRAFEPDVEGVRVAKGA